MTDDTRIIWAYTERHLREWLQDLYDESSDDGLYDFPDPASLTAEQIDDLYRRINETTEGSDGPKDGMRNFAWMIMTDMGLIRERPTQ